MKTLNMLKFKILYASFSLISIIFISSCQDVIEINLDSVEPQLVVDGQIRIDSVCNVFLSTTSDFFNVDTFIYVNDAQVSITNQLGETEPLQFNGDGQYRGSLMIGKSGYQYTLNIFYNNILYSGKSIMADSTVIYSVKIKDADAVLGGNEPFYVLELNFKASKQTPYYLIKYYAIGDLIGFNAIDGSRFIHNDTITYTSAQRRFKKGELARVEIYPVDEELYQYYRQLSDVAQTNLRNTSAPYNPASNINNQALGAFAAWHPSVYELLIE